ncbi:MAG: SPOR domain-containing protein [Halobacteriovoraceae bacterium]|nr:SPOR domain-containing protein [Halobacteriovoraceae bacterium]MCB9093793.1 SPOR domain-containing protein [Halobacteriovoraceae bacterium]
MDKRNRVFVFDRVELSLLVFFFVVMSVTAFVMGIRFGKKLALESIGVTEEHMKEVELKSEREEYVDEVMQKEESMPADPGAATMEEGDAGSNEKDIDEEAFKKLQDEFEKLDRKNFEPPKPGDEANSEVMEESTTTTTMMGDEGAEEQLTEKQLKIDPSIMGKYTIQLGSYKTIDEAQSFAEGFIARGYKPLVNEVEISGKGIWYRVSLGIFDSINAAKAYVNREKSLFNNQDYVISKIE